MKYDPDLSAWAAVLCLINKKPVSKKLVIYSILHLHPHFHISFSMAYKLNSLRILNFRGKKVSVAFTSNRGYDIFAIFSADTVY